MSEPCGTCLGGPDCLPSNDLNLMSLDSTIFPFVPVCPPGRDCFGTSLGAGTISFPACNQVLTRSLPAGLSVDQWLQIIGQMLAQATQLIQFCSGDIPPTTPPVITPGTPVFLYFNDPQTCTAYCPDGSPFTYTVGAGVVIGFDLFTVNQQAYAIACRNAKSQIICLNNPTLGPYCGGATINATFIATGSSLAAYPLSDYWEMVDGTLPSGVTFPGGFITGGQASLRGTAGSGGIFTFTIRVTNPNGGYQQKTYSFRVININTASPMPNGTMAVPYSQTLSETGATGTVSWAVVSGALPTGLTLNSSTGEISGTPTANGTYSFTVQVTDT